MGLRLSARNNSLFPDRRSFELHSLLPQLPPPLGCACSGRPPSGELATWVHAELRHRHSIEVPVAFAAGKMWCRISAQIYNELSGGQYMQYRQYNVALTAEVPELMQRARAGPTSQLELCSSSSGLTDDKVKPGADGSPVTLPKSAPSWVVVPGLDCPAPAHNQTQLTRAGGFACISLAL